MKFDPFEQAWKDMDEPHMRAAQSIVAAVREAVGVTEIANFAQVEGYDPSEVASA